MTMTAAYAELQCATNYSFLCGASHPEELVEQAAVLGHKALAITDFNSLAGVVRAHVQAKEAGLKIIIGARITPVDGPDLLLYPTDRAAYGRLCRLITLGRRRAEKGKCHLTVQDVIEHGEGQIIVADLKSPITDHQSPILSLLHTAFHGRCYLAAHCLYGADERIRLRTLHEIAQATGIPLVATNDVHYHAAERRPLQDVLVCIREGCTIHDAGYRLFPNGERYLKPPEEMARLFAEYPEAIARTVEIADQCTFNLDELRYEYPTELAPAGMTPMEYLTQLSWSGARERFPAGVPDKVRQQIEHELRLIEELRYEAYFLTVYDVVKFARSRAILCQGRGSAANSAVCYCIGVTSVDPARIDLLFERFVSRERNEPPDIDVDFEHERREEVIQYIYGKYGRERAGLTAEVITYRARSAVRDVGKALGLSLDAVDQLAKTCDWWDREVPVERLRALGLNPDDLTVRMTINLSRRVAAFPRHLSQHVGGFVMTRGPLCEMVPIENAAMPDRTVIEWNKDDIDALGILKVDVLGLGMLTCIRKAFDMINAGSCDSRDGKSAPAGAKANSRGRQPPDDEAEIAKPRRGDTLFQLHTIPPEDPAVYDMCCRADTIGVFQIESRAQMSMLPRLRPRNFYDLVIEVSIVRPGPIQGNMVHPYLRRRQGKEAITFPSPAVEDVLRKTLGVPLFQEQVMKLAVVAAGFTPGEADQLRRAMAAWRRQGLISKFQRKFIDGMLANGYDRDFAERMFRQIEGFGEYGFPESHAASFALLVYVSAWLKRYHPAAFAAALINSQPMGFYAPAQIVRDARAHGVEVREIDVNCSEWDCTLEDRACKSPRDFRFQISDFGFSEAPAIGCRPSGAESLSGQNLSAHRAVCTCESESGNPQAVHPPRRAIHNPQSDPSTWGHDGPAIRLGMRLIKGLRENHAHAIAAARASGPFESVADIVRRSGVPRVAMVKLARADAFRSLGLDRRAALWHVMALDKTAGSRRSDPDGPTPTQHEGCSPDIHVPRDDASSRSRRAAKTHARPMSNPSGLLDGNDPDEPPVQLPLMPLGQHVAHDYATTGLSIKQHPVGLVRELLSARRVITAAELQTTPSGKWVSVAGLVICRQRPDTASGVLFVTLEDETGTANLIVRPPVYEKHRAAIRHATLLLAQGRIEAQDGVIHLLVHRAEDLSSLMPGLSVSSHDFH